MDSRDQFEREAAAKGHTAKVTVMRPCDCPACKTGREWFWCERTGANLVAEYLCPPAGRDCPAVPHPDALRVIEAEHPGMIYIYID